MTNRTSYALAAVIWYAVVFAVAVVLGYFELVAV